VPRRADIIGTVAASVGGDPRDERANWPVRLYRLGEEPPDDQSLLNTPEQRLAMMWELALGAWSLGARPLPTYAREETPVACRPWAPSRPGS
jgi:hypothetical protein